MLELFGEKIISIGVFLGTNSEYFEEKRLLEKSFALTGTHRYNVYLLCQQKKL
jgi:hypothetical protein